MFLRNAEVIKHRAALRPMFYSKIVNGESLKTLVPSQIGSCGGESASVSEPIFEPVKRATFQIVVEPRSGATTRIN